MKLLRGPEQIWEREVQNHPLSQVLTPAVMGQTYVDDCTVAPVSDALDRARHAHRLSALRGLAAPSADAPSLGALTA